jgi:hypothetical protein
MTESEYKELVLEDFDQKLKDRSLPPELVSLTRRSLKKHSVNICARRFDPKDESLLSSFFGEKEDAAAYMKAIQKKSAEVFKTLHNFLNDRKINTSFDNIRLLAWLIDFQPRPYHPDLKVPVRSVKPVRPTIIVTTDTGGNTMAQVKTWLLKNKKKVILYSMLALVLSIGGYLITKSTISPSIGIKGCMIWTGNQYEPIACDQQRGDLPVFKLDTQKVADFKRVKTDTLSPRALGHVWYAKFGGQVEFYSDSGQHPVDTNKRLLPLTSHILNKYVFHVADPK